MQFALSQIRPFTFAITAAIGALAIRADTLELKTGEHIEGAFKQATSAGAVIVVGGQAITIPLERVRAIYLGAAPEAVQRASLAGDALAALKGLQSVTTSGITYLQYTPRVLDAKVKVDQYLSSPIHSDEPVRASIAQAIRYYEIASQTWHNAIAPDFLPSVQLVTYFQKQELQDCPVINRARADAAALRVKIPQGSDPDSYSMMILFMSSGIAFGKYNPTPGLWSCASDKLAEAEKLFNSELEVGGEQISKKPVTQELLAPPKLAQTPTPDPKKPHIVGIDPL